MFKNLDLSVAKSSFFKIFEKWEGCRGGREWQGSSRLLSATVLARMHTQGPGHTRTLLWLWTDAHPSTEHPSVSAPASLCFLFLVFVSLAPTLFPSICLISLSRSAVWLFPLRHYKYAFPCLFISPSLCLQSSVSNTMPVTPGKLLGMWPPSLLT